VVFGSAAGAGAVAVAGGLVRSNERVFWWCACGSRRHGARGRGSAVAR
jgi:hypothetical protein